MIRHIELSDKDLLVQIKQGCICFGGNAKLAIYGRLHCASGKRMNKANRVFFYSEEEALAKGFRPCGHCMKHKYKKRKNGII